MATGGSIRKGWYQDPSGRYRERYWDGRQWTDRLHPEGEFTGPPSPNQGEIAWTPDSESTGDTGVAEVSELQQPSEEVPIATKSAAGASGPPAGAPFQAPLPLAAEALEASARKWNGIGVLFLILALLGSIALGAALAPEKVVDDGFSLSTEPDTGEGFQTLEELPRLFHPAAGLADDMKDAPCIVFALALRNGPADSVIPAVQNLMLAARAIGIGSVPTTLHPNVMDRFCAMFDIPDDVAFHFCIPLGYPQGHFGPNVRKPTSETTFLNRWSAPVPWG